MSALLERVTATNVPNVPQTPFVSGAEARSATPRVLSTPAPASVPWPIVSETEFEYQGPLWRAIVCPVGAVESAAIVTVADAVPPPPLVATTVFAPGATAPVVQV